MKEETTGLEKDGDRSMGGGEKGEEIGEAVDGWAVGRWSSVSAPFPCFGHIPITNATDKKSPSSAAFLTSRLAKRRVPVREHGRVGVGVPVTRMRALRRSVT